MRARAIGCVCALSLASALGQYHFPQRDAKAPNVLDPQPTYAVMTAEDERMLGGEQKAVEDLGKRIDGIEKDLGTLKDQVKTLNDTSVIVRFVMNALALLVPGLIIGLAVAAFSVWFTQYIKRKDKPATS